MESIVRLPVKSSLIASVGYSKHALVLAIEFSSGAVYEYDDVPAECFEQLVQAESCGRFFNRAIRDRFPCRRTERS